MGRSAGVWHAISSESMRLIGDKAYDCDGLDRQMQEQYGIEVIAPHRGDRKEPTQDGRLLRRCRRRRTIERLFAWLQIYRRLATRWEYHVGIFETGSSNFRFYRSFSHPRKSRAS